MFHLLKSLYVQTERLPDNITSQINISTSGGYQRDESLVNSGSQLGYTQSLDDLTPQQFKDLIAIGAEYPEKVLIVADSITYTRLFSIMIKALFPEITYTAFKRLFICRKASYDLHAISYAGRYNGAGLGVIIDHATVGALFELEDPLVAPMREMVSQAPEMVSLEWRIARMILTGTIDNVPETLKYLLNRSAIATGQETASEWARFITDESTWEFSGCTEFSLLNSGTTIGACKNLGNLSNEVLSTALASKADLDASWIVEMLTQCIEVLNRIGEPSFALRAAEAIKHVNAILEYDTVEECLLLVNALFNNGELTIQTTGDDIRKFDENAIRWMLAKTKPELEALLGEVTW
jgi:hypothetical protein